jgi:hypothetical protein
MQNLSSLFLSVLTVCVVILGTEASAQSLIDATDPDEIRNLASGYGSASLTTASDDTPMISGRIDGTAYSIYFYGCKDAKNCRSIQFSSSWQGNVTTDAVSEWNRTKRFGSAYIESDGDTGLQWDVNLYAGVSRENLDDTIDWWRVTLKAFEIFLNEQD